MRRVVLSLFASTIVVVGCQATPRPLGEALVIVRTDVAVPKRVGRVRIDVHDATGKLLETREVITPTAAEWPVSFSVVAPDDGAEHDVRLRIRAYPEGHVLSARELERFSRQPARNVAVFPSIEETCANAPDLRLGEPKTLRRGATPITSVLPSLRPDNSPDCTRSTNTGSVAAKLVIPTAGTYQVEVIRSVPDGALDEPGGDTTLSLRTDCLYPTTQIVCADDIVADENRLSRVTAELNPGTYFVVTGGDRAAPADLTLFALRADAFQQVPAPPSEAPLAAPPGALEPEHGVTIDRLVRVHLVPGERGNVEVMLHGECFGTNANMADMTTCTSTAGVRRPAGVEVARAPLTLPPPGTMAPPSWGGDEEKPCTVQPRPDGALFDGEVCVPGGAFVLGDMLALVDLDRRAQPERMRVVQPFLIDKYEMTVARYRDAVRRGFTPVDDTPKANGDPKFDPTLPGKTCTWNAGASNEPLLDRESYPLNCVSWATARAVCQFLGGDLPNEDQWEYAATVGKDGIEMPYPWGRDLPTCQKTAYARGVHPQETACAALGVGPAKVTELGEDVSPRGVIGLAGNVQEWLVTPFVAYADPAWEKAGLRTVLEEPEPPLRAVRGADWLGFALFATGSARRAQPVTGNYTTVGFRCSRPGR